MPVLPKKNQWSVEYLSRNIFQIRLDFSSPKAEYWFLLSSDRHHDSPFCDHVMERRHLDECRERGAGIIDNGDLFDAMQGRDDKRRSFRDLDPSYAGDDYFTRVLQGAAEFYGPYADRFISLGYGNHESAALKRSGVDLISGLASILNDRHGTSIRPHGYSGWIVFRCNRSTQRQTFALYRHHGWGGSSPSTQGIGKARDMAAWCPDADIVMTGHSHNSWITRVDRLRLNIAGVQGSDSQLHTCVPGYKRGLGDGWGGFEVERQPAPKPIGATWLLLARNGTDVHCELREAR